MHKKSSQPQTSPQPGGGVDFLVRTMIERESTGKRPIRPKNVEDLLQSTMQDESDDPDFDCGDEDSDSAGTVGTDDGSNDSDNEGDGTQDSDESDDEDYQGKDDKEDGSSSDDNEESGSNDESSNDDESQGSDSDTPDVSKKSALRETLEKLNEVSDFIGKRSTKKKRKVAKNRENSKPKKVVAKKSNKKKLVESTKLKSSSAQKSVKSTGKKKSGSKTKKVVLSKKSKISSRKILSEKKKKKKSKKFEDKSKHRSILSLIDSAVNNQKENRKEIEVTKPICSACLGDKSDDSNEIVECDSCGISVHEICYGLSADNLSISSGSGSSSCTEPWFCDVCKSGSENMYCELCPIEGGLFKESTAGRWVHLVCAMYTQGVALHHDSSINLYEIHYARWGSHNCAACENERQAHTGIVISCDAGLCKTYFHATCAQKLGLLSDPNQVDFAEADPYYVSCKLHTNRETMKRRIRLFNTLQEQLRIKKERKELEGLPSGANSDHARILRKLDKVRQKTALKRAQYLNSLDNVTLQITAGEVGVNPLCNLPSSWTSGNKKQRLMHTSAKLGSDFVRKIERLGEDIVANELEVKHEKIVANVKRKWNVLPGMSVEYAAYYSDRENRISGLVDQYEKSCEENHILMDKEIGLKDVYETHVVNQMAMTEETESVSKQLESLASILTSVCPNDKKLATKLQCIVKPKELTGARRKSPSTSKGDRKSPTPRRSSTAKKLLKNRVLSPSPSRAGKLAVAVCDTCSKSDSQHLITRCDKCRKHYHLSCLDPPLTRMPKRSRLCGWMCSDCCEAPSEAEGHVDTEAPRTLRGRTKIHKPRKYRGSDESEDEKSTLEADTPKAGSKKSPKSNVSSFNSPEAKSSAGDPIVPVATPASTRIYSSTPMERRRRSGSANLSTVAPAITAICSPITPLLTNGPIVVPEIPSMKMGGKTAPHSDVNSSVELTAITSSTIEAKPSKKKKAATTPKAARLKKQKKRNSQDHSTPTNDFTNNSQGVSPLKRKSSDGPLTTFKVNGIHDNPLQYSEDNKLVAPKPKPRAKKQKQKTILPVNVEFKSEISSVETSFTDQGGKNVKQKKPRKKKEAVVKSEGIDVSSVSSSIIDIKKEDIPKVEKIKKPRKKKEKNDTSNTSINIVATPEDASAEIDKKAKKKSAKKISMIPGTIPTVNVAREEANGVKLAIGEVTSQFFFKNLQNGTVKITKKRKNNQGTAETALQQTAELLLPSPDEKEKEKSVPPKKRKRVSSSANPGQPNSVDSIIEAVSSGDFSDRTLVNGGCDVKPSDMSSVMQRVSPMSRQAAPEHRLMQGKAMSSGFNPGEMVTVNASFLIDGATSSQSSFSVSNSTVSTFYASSSQQDSTGVSQNEAGVLKLTASGGNCESGNSENVIRLQYIDAPSGPITDSATMPPPAPLSSSSNVFPQGMSDVCFTCTKTDNKMQLVTCDKCLQAYHLKCLNPPQKYSPRRKGHPWFCHNCDDGETQHQENGVLPPIN